ncbi:MAG TPA: TetR/AcrR family transcriptional regulator [Solirubrobacteraceae bacterium]|nr:TetR/AcrR family transcriptional regulator [Solirubrobacteraceae bacterium]
MSQAERSQATRARLLEAAYELFAARGYAAVGTEEIVRAAGVTRGALYHHFADKRQLFEAVYEDLERGLVERLAQAALAAASDDPLEALKAGTSAFLEDCEDPAVQQIAVLDAPSVLGWERWRAIGMKYAFGLVQGALQEAVDAGEIAPQPVEPIAHLLLGASHEGAMLVARAKDDGATRRQVADSIGRFLDSLRPGDTT